MELTLTPELQQFIEEKVRCGQYPSPRDVVLDALTRLKQMQDEKEIGGEELDALIEVGMAEADRGDLLDCDEVFEELRQRSLRRRGMGG